jgi:hypothetical protein
MSTNAMVLRTGQTLGPVILAALFSLWGLEGVFFSGGAIALLLLATVSVLIRR